MKLSAYLADNKETQADFAARVGVTQGAISRIALGERIPRRALMHRIMIATAGRVTVSDFFEEITAPREPLPRARAREASHG